MYCSLLAVCGLMLHGIAFAQSGNRVAPGQTFHVEGIIGDALDAVIPHVEVHFVGARDDQTVTADDKGFYQTDLAVGAYTMTAALPPSGPGRRSPFKKYVRFFRVSSSGNVKLDVTLNPEYYCDGVWLGNDAEEGYKDSCGGEDSFPFPSKDAAPLRLDIRYRRRMRGEGLVSYSSNDPMNPVLVVYNLFALRADSVDFSRTDRTIKASGHVVIEDQSGHASASFAVFKFDDGKAVRIW